MARRTILLSLILGWLAAANAVHFDFYYLILMWPGAYCEDSSNGCCAPKYGYPSEDFLVQSLMAFDLATNKPVIRCNGNRFDPNQLDQIENNLNHYWSNINCPSTDGMNTLESAWNNYGVCSGLQQLDYFKAALQLRRQAGVLSALAEQGIKPDYKLYRTEAIKRAVSQKLGVAPGVQCRKGPFGKMQLYQIYLCVDRDARTFIECPKLPPALHCPEEVVFHPYYNWMLNTTSALDAKIQLPTNCNI